MRLRFGRPAPLILVLFAVIAGIGFYLWDNAPAQPAQPPASALTEVAVNRIMPPTIVPMPTPTVLPTIPFTGTRRELPDNTTIFIPRAGIYSRVIESYLNGFSWDVSQLRTNVGHLEGTPWLDQPGNVVLSGHVELANGRPGVFANLDELATDDIIVLTSSGEEYRFIITTVYSTVPNDLQPLMPTTEDRLTLITCDSYDFFSNSYLERTIVIAERLG